MEKYQRVLVRRLALLLVFLALVSLSAFILRTRPAAPFIRGIQFGALLALLIFLYRKLIRCSQALLNKKKRMALQVAESDERTRLIWDKTGGNGYSFCLALFAVALVIAGGYDQKVFYTLLGVTVLMALVKGALKLYYNKKY